MTEGRPVDDGPPLWFQTGSVTSPGSGRVGDARGGLGFLGFMGEPEAARLHQVAKQRTNYQRRQDQPPLPAAPKVAQQPAKVPGM